MIEDNTNNTNDGEQQEDGRASSSGISSWSAALQGRMN